MDNFYRTSGTNGFGGFGTNFFNKNETEEDEDDDEEDKENWANSEQILDLNHNLILLNKLLFIQIIIKIWIHF